MEDVPGSNDTFIFGSAVKVSPILDSISDTTKTFKSHFPKGRWLNLANWKVEDVKDDSQIDLDATQETVQVHLRPGSILPMHDLSNQSVQALNTQDLAGLPLTVVINRNQQKSAKGTVFLDGGISNEEIRLKTYEYYNIEHKSSKSI